MFSSSIGFYIQQVRYVPILASVILLIMAPASGFAQNDVFFLHDTGVDTLMNWAPDGWTSSCPNGDEVMTCELPEHGSDGTIIELDSLNPYVFHLDHDGCVSADYPAWLWNVTLHLSGRNGDEVIFEVGVEECTGNTLCDSQQVVAGPETIELDGAMFCEARTVVFPTPAFSVDNQRIYISIRGDAELCLDSEAWPSQVTAASEIICASSVEPRAWGAIKALYRVR